jgi:hypothetical protein
MRVFELRGLAPDASAIASEAFSRSWHFIERDPVLAGHDERPCKRSSHCEFNRSWRLTPRSATRCGSPIGRSVGCGTKRENRGCGLLR